MELLEIPWEKTKYLKYKYDLKPLGGSIYRYYGKAIPTELKYFQNKDFSYARWRQDDLLGKVTPPEKSRTVFKPRPHQLEAAKKIYASYQRGWSGFLLADKTGIGKTLSSLAGITAIAKKDNHTPQNKGKLLIVCPKGVIPVWRQHIHSYPAASALMRIMIINYQQLNKLLKEPKSTTKVKTRRTRNRRIASSGVPTVDWDYIIFDEAQYLKNFPSSAVSMSAVSIAKLNNEYKKGVSPFTIFVTATPGSSPLNFALMSGFVAKLLSKRSKTVTPKEWGDFLAKEGFAVKKGKTGYTWAAIPWFGKNSDDPEERMKYEIGVREAKKSQRRDAQRIGKALLTPGAPFIMRSPKNIAGWPEQQYIPLPLELTHTQQPIYEEAWTRFRNWLKLTPAKSDPKGALVETLRYRQKSSLLKVESMIEQIEDFIEDDKQVYISVEFLETLDEYRKSLAKKNIDVAEISGRNTEDREVERVKFQKGEVKVVLCTVVAGISLHAGETLPDGTKATDNERITILHDIRQNNLDATQTAGRAHRDGMNSLTFIPFFEETVDSKVVASFVNKDSNMKSMLGASKDEAEELENIFRDAAV